MQVFEDSENVHRADGPTLRDTTDAELLMELARRLGEAPRDE
jgi:hypothetical protein